MFDADGALRIVDRNKDLIIRGGDNFYPREIEEVLHRHPDVAQAAMFGVPDARMAKRSWRCRSEAGRHSRPKDIVAWSAPGWPATSAPHIGEVGDNLPLGPTGKVLKQALRPSARSQAA